MLLYILPLEGEKCEFQVPIFQRAELQNGDQSSCASILLLKQSQLPLTMVPLEDPM